MRRCRWQKKCLVPLLIMAGCAACVTGMARMQSSNINNEDIVLVAGGFLLIILVIAMAIYKASQEPVQANDPMNNNYYAAAVSPELNEPHYKLDSEEYPVSRV